MQRRGELQLESACRWVVNADPGHVPAVRVVPGPPGERLPRAELPGWCDQPQAKTSRVAWRSQDDKPASTNRAPSISGRTAAALDTPCGPSPRRLPLSTLTQGSGSLAARPRLAHGPRTSMARRAQSAASWLAAGLGCGSRPTAVRASATSARLLARSVALIPASWPPPSIVSATAASRSSPAGGAGRCSRRTGTAGPPVRSMRMLRPGPTGMSSHRVPGGGTAERPSTPASCQPPSSELQGEPVAPALVVGHPGAAERREAGLWRGGTAGGAGRGPPGADEAGGDGGSVRREHERLNVDLAPVAVPLRREHDADRDGLIPAAGRTAARLRPGCGVFTQPAPARAGQYRGVVQAAGGQCGGELRGQAGRRGPAEQAHLAQSTHYRADPVQADFLRWLATRLEVLVQPPVPR